MRPDYIDKICSALEREVKGAVEMVRKVVYPTEHGQEIVGPTYRAMRIVLAINDEGNLRVCRREAKEENEKELLLLRKRELKEGGLSRDYWEKVIEKVAAALEKRGVVNRSESYSVLSQMALWEAECG